MGTKIQNDLPQEIFNTEETLAILKSNQERSNYLLKQKNIEIATDNRQIIPTIIFMIREWQKDVMKKL